MNLIPGNRTHRGSIFGAWPTFFEEMMPARDYAPFMPSVNIRETESEWKIEMAVPGFTKDDFKVNLSKETLTISGEHKAESEKEAEKYVRKEYSFGSFSRTFALRENSVDTSRIAATYENGVLYVSLPKRGEEAKKDISISVK